MAKAKRGARGQQGRRGPAGPPGKAGVEGVRGPMGRAGRVGLAGVTGARGAKGATGADTRAGSKGRKRFIAAVDRHIENIYGELSLQMKRMAKIQWQVDELRAKIRNAL